MFHNRILFTVFIFAVVCLANRSFEVKDQKFYMDDQPFQYVSGSFHYFRVHPDRWEDVFQKMVAGSLNVVETYIAWNIHEPKENEYNFEGFANITRWLDMATKHGLYVILRPGPYICAEWDFGGLPYWLLNKENIAIREFNKPYIEAVDKWFSILLPMLKPYLYVNGGNIISVQIENEYGSFGKCDKNYMRHLLELNQHYLGNDTIYFTVDGASNKNLECGRLDGIYMTIDFGTSEDPSERFEVLRKYENQYPLVNTEFYTGWLDHWGENHHIIDTELLTTKLDKMLSMGASVNLYMYIGGTNHGFYNGANGGLLVYQPDITSYDYDAPLSENGDVTYKWASIRDTVHKYIKPVGEYDVKNSTKKNYGSIEFTQGVSLWDALEKITDEPFVSEELPSLEAIGCDYGYALFTTTIKSTGVLLLSSIRDRAYIYVNRKYYGVIYRSDVIRSILIKEVGELEILVENMGRINFSSFMQETHGLPGGVTLNLKTLKNWKSYTLHFKDLSSLPWSSQMPTLLPVFYRTKLSIKEADLGDTYLEYQNWGKGVAWINEFNLGRYWYKKPQYTLYIAKELLKEENDIIILETEYINPNHTMGLQDTAILI